MIHYLLKEELETMDDITNFNYLHFMEKYNLKTMTDEIEKKKVIYHEIGHKDHNPGQYKRRREEYELQADRKMKSWFKRNT